MQLDDATTILGRADFFTVCDAEQRRLLAFASERKKWRANSVIYQAGDTPEGAHVLVSGTVATYQEGDESNPYVISSQGAVLGAMSLVVSKPRPVTVKAIDNVETLFVPRSAFLKLANQAPDLARRAADRIRSELVGYLGAIEQVRPKIGSSKS
ncbi:MAG: cyclic nucleotide-binding domain-containing protein [Devosia sp.]|jgi:CRP-like cAMP-binding protein|uniref:cyclic nucleotide-binding domain-containing protein n=1 Tax=Devosia sp. TaxID=1871048 RepID=UPI001A520689|nr:cyclic nucleotide-binding domain-containing protein [Devosia sp.]MBL8597665.1 cyclic nucleotide-binding domain-containing protein [Devosia sp.]